MKVPARLIGLFAIVGIVAAVGWPLRFGELARSAIEAQIGAATGLIAHVGGPVTLKLLPRPRVRLFDVSARDPNGATMLDVPVVQADLDPLSLLAGQWRLVSATLLSPTVTLDDGDLAPPQREPSKTPAIGTLPGGFRLAVRGGVVRVRSRIACLDTLVTGLDAAFEQASADGALSASGAADWHGTRARFSFGLAHPSAVARGGTAAGELRVESPLASLFAAGSVTGGPTPMFDGHLSMASDRLPALARALDAPDTAIAVDRGRISADVALTRDGATFSAIALRLDEAALEGSLAYRGSRAGGRWEATLAANTLDLDRLTIPLRTSADGWRSLRLRSGMFGSDLDLRVSAATATLGAVAFTDAALTAVVRDDRIDLTLDGARAFGGEMKSRVAATLSPGGLDAHAEVGVDGLDLARLSAAVAGGPRVAGTASARLSVDGHGESLEEVVRHGSGNGSVSVRDGDFKGLSVSQTLRRFGRRLPRGVDLPGNVTMFDTAEAALRIDGGVMSILDGRVVGPGVSMTFGGRSDLPQGSIAIQAVAAQTDPSGALVPTAPRFPFELRGNWDGPLSIDDHPTFPTLPSFQVPDLAP